MADKGRNDEPHPRRQKRDAKDPWKAKKNSAPRVDTVHWGSKADGEDYLGLPTRQKSATITN